MKYFDLHCDALTKKGVVCASSGALEEGGCALLTLAAFVPEREDAFGRANALFDKFDALVLREGCRPVRGAEDLAGEGRKVLLSVEGGAAGNIDELRAFYRRGVRMLSFVWNYENALGFPVFPDYGKIAAGRISPYVRERERGLKPLGRELLSEMLRLGMIADVSHGSDALFFEVAAECRRAGKPFVASHSDAAEICPWARNLTDGELKALGDGGGVVGLNFCADFLSPVQTKEGQREAVLAHARHILNAGGEDVLAIGSDFDGTPPNPYLPSPAAMQGLLALFGEEFGPRVAEKIAYGNALRVLSACL